MQYSNKQYSNIIMERKNTFQNYFYKGDNRLTICRSEALCFLQNVENYVVEFGFKGNFDLFVPFSRFCFRAKFFGNVVFQVPEFY